MKPKVLLGMSGGTDSTVAAMLLQQQGYEVFGVTLYLFDQFQQPGKAPTFIEEAKQLAAKLEMEHLVYDAKELFRTVVLQYFQDEYFSGRTPFPCVVCNKQVKWKILKELADRFDCGYIATGHYVQTKEFNGRKYIAQATDPDKDQSFFLWNLETSLLNQIVFPLGGMLKSDVRKLAEEKGFPMVAKKPDSLGVCFIEGGDYRRYLNHLLAESGMTIVSGNYIDGTGSFIGTHDGYPNYTIGQRRGLKHGQNKVLFVTGIDANTNSVQLGEFRALMKRTILVSKYHFYYPCDIDPANEYIVKIRYRNQATPCRIEVINAAQMVLHLHEEVHSVAPGQSAVLFDGDRVIGGGVIESAGI